MATLRNEGNTLKRKTNVINFFCLTKGTVYTHNARFCFSSVPTCIKCIMYVYTHVYTVSCFVSSEETEKRA